jgi:hypothetical protein
MRLASWLGSLALHGALVAVAWWCASGTVLSTVPMSINEIAIVDVEVVRPPELVVTAPRGGGGGGDGGKVAMATPRRAAGARRPAMRAAGLGPIQTEGRSAGRGGGSGGGVGTGVGSGVGDGIGAGAGLGEEAPRAAMRRAVVRDDARPPPPSKARPPRLIWPKQERAEVAERLFAAVLTIDEEGYVVGVKLTRGTTARESGKAASAVWRFRYDPALDDAGRPVKARLEQKFMLE